MVIVDLLYFVQNCLEFLLFLFEAGGVGVESNNDDGSIILESNLCDYASIIIEFREDDLRFVFIFT